MFLSSGQDEDASSQRLTENEAITYDAIVAKVDNGDAVLLDVRTPSEYQESYIAPAENYPLQLLMQDQLPEIAKDKTIYLYCRTGNRSAQAATILRQAGFEQVIDLGGLSDMVSLGGELVID